MNKLQGMMGLSLVALLLGSCTSNSQLSKREIPTQKPLVGQNSVNSKSPTASSADSAAPVQGLIRPSESITIPIARGRRDPFGSIAVAPISQQVDSKPTQKTQLNPQPTQQKSTQKTQLNPQPAQQKSTQKAQLNSQSKQQKSTQKAQLNPQPIQEKLTQGNKVKTHTASTSKQKTFTVDKKTISKREITPKPVNPTRAQLDKTNSVKPLPIPSPSTELANAVEIKGVMQVGGKLTAIIKEPDQKARYVSQGEHLSKGAVLVKRIELAANQEPRVILEQNGIEVVKPVSGNDSPVASLP